MGRSNAASLYVGNCVGSTTTRMTVSGGECGHVRHGSLSRTRRVPDRFVSLKQCDKSLLCGESFVGRYSVMSSYKSGALILRIGQSDIPQEWDMREATRSFMNDAFKLYFNGKKVIEEVDFDTGLAMQRALFEASSNGFGIGGNKGVSWFEPDDLIEAIEYLDTRGGKKTMVGSYRSRGGFRRTLYP